MESHTCVIREKGTRCICLSLYQTTKKFLDWFSLKDLAGDKKNVTEKLKFVLGRIENIVGKGENAGYHTMFSKGFFPRVNRNRDGVLKS